MKKINKADPIFYRGYSIRHFISPETKKHLLVAIPKGTVCFISTLNELDLIKDMVDEQTESDDYCEECGNIFGGHNPSCSKLIETYE
jgi:hypothetical protein